MKKTIIIILSALTGFLLVLMLLAFLFVNGKRVAGFVEEELGNNYDVKIESAAFNLFSRTLRLGGISVLRNPDGQLFETESLIIKQLVISDLFFGNFSAGEVELENFMLDLRILQQSDSTGGSVAADTTTNRGSGGGSTARENGRNSKFVIDSVVLTGGNVLFSDGKGGSGEVENLHVHVEPVSYDFGCDDCSPVSEVRNLSVQIPDLHYDLPGGRYRLNVMGVILNEENQSLNIQQVVLSPSLSREEFFNSLTYRTDMYELELRNTVIYELAFKELREEQSIRAQHMSIDSLGIHVTLDKRVQEDPDPGEKKMPLTALNGLEYEVELDSIRFEDADILYSEIDENGARPGTITFEDTRASITNISTQTDQALVVKANSHLEGIGKLDTVIRMAMEDSETRVDVTGSLGRFEMNRFNNILVNLEGIRITEGLIHQLDFDFTMNQEFSEGVVKINYEDFNLEMVDRTDAGQDLGDQIIGRLVNSIVLRSSGGNDSDESGIGEISAERDPEKSFLNYLWISLRSGLMDAIRRI